MGFVDIADQYIAGSRRNCGPILTKESTATLEHLDGHLAFGRMRVFAIRI